LLASAFDRYNEFRADQVVGIRRQIVYREDTAMTVFELIKRFREIPPDLHDEPVLATFAETFGPLLKLANKPSACSTQHDAGNHYYMKFIAPIGIYGYRLCTREDVLQQLQELIDQHRADPTGFTARLLPTEIAAKEIKGPGCA
jgi:hypothetical protein